MKDHTSGGAPPVVEEYGTRVGQVGEGGGGWGVGACVGQKCQQCEDGRRRSLFEMICKLFI